MTHDVDYRVISANKFEQLTQFRLLCEFITWLVLYSNPIMLAGSFAIHLCDNIEYVHSINCLKNSNFL